jgi:hypothetical protein
MKMLRVLIDMLFFCGISGQILVGYQRDSHNCVLDGGYEWCDSLQRCIRQWDTPCDETDGINPVDPVSTDCHSRRSCPSPIPCPEPYMPEFNMNNCKISTSIDSCGCTTGCPHYDCRNVGCESDLDCRHDEFCRPNDLRSQIPIVNGRRLQLPSSECVGKVGINETCGGMVSPQYQTRCLDGLECVNVHGQMIADAPGVCKEPCSRGVNRNENGECISKVDFTIPNNCLVYYDGCNNCKVRNGRAEMCTKMYCFVKNHPYCMTFHKNELEVGDLCYRFCEDGSQSVIDLRDNCPKNTECISTLNENSVSMIYYDSCDDRFWTCELVGH